MGFRSTFTTLDYPIEWPEWFKEKYKSSVSFGDKGCGALHSIGEYKTYGIWETLHDDIRAAIDWSGSWADRNFVLVYLHECGGITRCQIEKDSIKWTEPESWRVTDGVEHNYCYDCSVAP